MHALLLTAAASALAAGCGRPDKALEGSLTEVVDLTYRTADLTRGESDLAVRFVAPQGAGENVVLRLTVSTLGTLVNANEPIDLAEPDANGQVRGTVTRNVLEDPLQTLPAIARGELVFDRPLEGAGRVKGELHITFAQGTTVASGRTVFGPFEAKVE